MPPLTVTRGEPDGDGGFLIEWHDPANLEGPITGFFHLTAKAVDELLVHQYRPNQVPDDDMRELRQWMMGQGRPADAAIIQRWRQEYDRIIQNRIDRHNFGMKAITRDGQADLEAVRAGAMVQPWNVSDRPSQLDTFIRQRSEPPIRPE